MSLVLHGVDFSGGDSPAGKIWVAARDGRRVELRRGFDHRSLVELIAGSGGDGRPHLWRIDAPFGLAMETLLDFELEHSWPAVARWLDGFDGAREWRSACRAMSRHEPRRVTDRAAKTPMAPQNLRVFKQTWSVITRVLLPLTERGVRIEPIAGPADAAVVVAEGCPASELQRRGWPNRGYKGASRMGARSDPPRERRRQLIESMRGAGLAIGDDVAARAVDDSEGDGVDALLLLLDPAHTVPPRESLVEAWVY